MGLYSSRLHPAAPLLQGECSLSPATPPVPVPTPVSSSPVPAEGSHPAGKSTAVDNKPPASCFLLCPQTPWLTTEPALAGRQPCPHPLLWSLLLPSHILLIPQLGSQVTSPSTTWPDLGRAAVNWEGLMRPQRSPPFLIPACRASGARCGGDRGSQGGEGSSPLPVYLLWNAAELLT